MNLLSDARALMLEVEIPRSAKADTAKSCSN